MGASARARRCVQWTEHNGGFGFQTKVKDCFLKQRRWTCWYSCRENMQVLSATDSLVWLFVFILKSLLSLLFTSCYTIEAFLIFVYYYYLIPQCLLNILNTNESIFCFSLKKWKVYRYKQNRPLSFLVKLTPRSFKWKQKEEFLSQNINHK